MPCIEESEKLFSMQNFFRFLQSVESVDVEVRAACNTAYQTLDQFEVLQTRIEEFCSSFSLLAEGREYTWTVKVYSMDF